MHASIERLKHLDKYDEAAMISARYGASKMLLLSSKTGDEYQGDEDGAGRYEGDTLDNVESGTVHDIGDRVPHDFDPKYPHEMYADFVKSALRGFSAGVGTSYHSVSNDLEGVNYSSIRAGVLEDREIYKGIQNWFVRALIRPVFEQWVKNAVLSGQIKIGSRPLARPVDEYLEANYQPRRWAWVDPQKDSAANQMALDNNLKTEGMLIEEQGGNPEDVWRRKVREQEFKESIGLKPQAQPEPKPEKVEEDDEDEED
jgi:lambda family phage portal protein